MLYTLSAWAVWLLGAAVVGILIGWLLRGRTSVSRHETSTEGDAPGRGRFDSLEVVAAERDRLRAEVLELRRGGAAKSSPAREVPQPPANGPLSGRFAERRSTPPAVASTRELAAIAAERDRLAAAVAKRDSAIRELRVRLWNDEVRISELEDRLTGRSVTEG